MFLTLIYYKMCCMGNHDMVGKDDMGKQKYSKIMKVGTKEIYVVWQIAYVQRREIAIFNKKSTSEVKKNSLTNKMTLYVTKMI